jgi:phage terminase large subunit-like protein
VSSALSQEDKQRLISLIKEKEDRKRFNKMLYWEPYIFQRELCNATKDCKQILGMMANQIGKSTAGAYVTACHLTGLYPDWWEGHKFELPIYAWAAGVSNDTTRDILQTELFGLAEDEEGWGSGMVPRHTAPQSNATRRRGTTGNTYDSVLVTHHHPVTGKANGHSRLGFKSYEMGEQKFYGRPVDWIWLDEQPPSNIYTQCITRTVATNGYVMMTFTPEDGMTPVVHQFMNDRQPGQYLLQASWDDAPHLIDSVKEQLLAQYPPHERDLRSKGIPVFGSGLVFPVSEETLVIEPFDLPDHWPRIAGLDFGWDHPTACVWIAHDTDSDTYYLYDEYSKNKESVVVHAAALNARQRWIPVAWPKDGLQSDKGSGISLAEQYRGQNVEMLLDWARNPLALGEKGKGNNAIEPGIMDMFQRMETGRFKVFSHMVGWLQEFRSYHRKDGKIVPMRDDLMSATRYACMAMQHARIGSNNNNTFGGSMPIQNWSSV